MNIVLISPYEIGRQPFGLAQPTAWLREAGFHVHCMDLAVDRIEPEQLTQASLIGLYLAMHTATRIAVEALPRIAQAAPHAYLCAYGLYAPMNAQLMAKLGVQSIFGGECEPDLLALAQSLQRDPRGTSAPPNPNPRVERSKIEFRVPDRSSLPPLDKYAKLLREDEDPAIIAFTEASRGCKHLCRHCPVVPIYEGRFRVVPVDVVLGDIDQQVRAGAQHVSFGDPDFLNGPTHALRVVSALSQRHPSLTYDITVKIQHIIQHAELIPELARTGCILVTSAVESVDPQVLEALAKHHGPEDFEKAVDLLQRHGIALAPTFVAFTPWTTLEGYCELLRKLVQLKLVYSVPPIQLAIRLLVPNGSKLLELEDFQQYIGEFDPLTLGFPWQHPDPQMDALHLDIQRIVEQGEAQDESRRAIFEAIWDRAHRAIGRNPPKLDLDLGETIPHHSERWYCCAEPTHQQLVSF